MIIEVTNLNCKISVPHTILIVYYIATFIQISKLIVIKQNIKNL